MLDWRNDPRTRWIAVEDREVHHGERFVFEDVDTGHPWGLGRGRSGGGAIGRSPLTGLATAAKSRHGVRWRRPNVRGGLSINPPVPISAIGGCIPNAGSSSKHALCTKRSPESLRGFVKTNLLSRLLAAAEDQQRGQAKAGQRERAGFRNYSCHLNLDEARIARVGRIVHRNERPSGQGRVRKG